MKKLYAFSMMLTIALTGLQSCAILTAAGISSQGQPTKRVPKDLKALDENASLKIDHQPWTQLLQKHVNNAGMVDYKGFQKDKEALDKYLNALSSYEPTEDWTVQELLAYYINLYNAYTVNLILDHYPVKSIKDIKGPWTKGIVPVGNRKLALGGIENGILRKMKDPRIHFAINCASISCPKLSNEAYTAKKIDEQLDAAAKEFINSDKNEISTKGPKLSSIFKWYKRDFVIHDISSVTEYINQYAEKKIDNDAEIQYLDYNWNLNEQ